MDNIKLLPEDLKWLGEFIFYQGDAAMVADNNPRAALVEGRLCIVALSYPGVVILEHPAAETLPREEMAWLSAKIGMTARGPMIAVNLHQLRLWAGPVVQTSVEFDKEGCGPNIEPRTRPCVIFGQMFDANLLAHALIGFDDKDVIARVSRPEGKNTPCVVRMPTGVVALMPMSHDDVPRIDGDGLRGGWGRDADKDESTSA